MFADVCRLARARLHEERCLSKVIAMSSLNGRAQSSTGVCSIVDVGVACEQELGRAGCGLGTRGTEQLIVGTDTNMSNRRWDWWWVVSQLHNSSHGGRRKGDRRQAG